MCCTFPFSIHRIERAGAEAAVRAAEDLATWAACEGGVASAPATTNVWMGDLRCAFA
jgi:hypothetical protein